MSAELNEHVEGAKRAIAKNLRLLRGLKRLTQKELSKISGATQGTISDLETGKGNPSIKVICRLACSLGVSYTDIVNPNPRETKEDANSATAGSDSAKWIQGNRAQVASELTLLSALIPLGEPSALSALTTHLSRVKR